MNFDAFVNEVIEKIMKEYKPYVILIAGGSCSGKTGLARAISGEFLDNNMENIIISMDDFYIGEREMKIKGLNENFDDITCIDIPGLRAVLRDLRSRKRAIKPIYNFSMHEREGYERVDPKEIILVEGLYALHHWVSEFGNYKLFLDCDRKTMLERRIKRDVEERGYDPVSVRKQFLNTVWPMYHEYILPTMQYANMVVHT